MSDHWFSSETPSEAPMEFLATTVRRTAFDGPLPGVGTEQTVAWQDTVCAAEPSARATLTS